MNSSVDKIEKLLGCDGPRRLLTHHRMTFLTRKAFNPDLNPSLEEMDCFFCSEPLGNGHHQKCIDEMDYAKEQTRKASE